MNGSPKLSMCLPALLLFCCCAAGEVPPDVAAVLDQYAATQKALQRCEQVTDVRCFVYYRGHDDIALHLRQRGEYRRDGGKAFHAYSDKRTDPFKPMPEALPPLPPAGTTDERFDSITYSVPSRDGITVYMHYPRYPTNGLVFLDLVEDDAERLQLVPDDRTGCWMRGWLVEDRRRLDDVLRGAGAAARAKRDVVDGRPCTLVEAETSGGKYAVWFDPSRGGNIVRARVERGPHHVTRYGRVWEMNRPGDQLPRDVPYGPEDENARDTTEITDVELARVGDVWLPVALKLTGVRVQRDGKGRKSEAWMKTTWDLTPTFPEDAFTLKIPDGSKVRLRWNEHYAEPPLEWRGGTVVAAPEGKTKADAR